MAEKEHILYRHFYLYLIKSNCNKVVVNVLLLIYFYSIYFLSKFYFKLFINAINNNVCCIVATPTVNLKTMEIERPRAIIKYITFNILKQN